MSSAIKSRSDSDLKACTIACYLDCLVFGKSAVARGAMVAREGFNEAVARMETARCRQ